MPRRLDKIYRHLSPQVLDVRVRDKQVSKADGIIPLFLSCTYTYIYLQLIHPSLCRHQSQPPQSPHKPSKSPNLNLITNMSSSSSAPSSDGMSPLLIATIVLTVLAAVAGAVYLSGAADDVVHYTMEKYFKAEAKAEEKILEQSGEKYAEGFL